MSAAHNRREEEAALWALLLRADELGVRLEVVGNQHTWELFPGKRHQEAIFRIQQSVSSNETRNGCGCFQYADLYVRFADGSIKRPDISIFCQEPAEEDGFVSAVPAAVIEVISPGYESKDLEQGPPLYLSQGVKDVVVLDARSGKVWHFSGAGEKHHASPTALTLSCGCMCTV